MDVHRLIREAIDTVATAEIRNAVIKRALVLADLPEIPPGGRPVRVFIRNHLRPALVDALGEETAENIVMSLSALMVLPTGAEITGYHTPREGSYPPPPPKPEKLPTRREVSLRRILLVSRDEQSITRIAREIGDRCPVETMSTVPQMVDVLQGDPAPGTVVVIDCSMSTLPKAVLAVESELPTGVRFLFWGATPEVEQKLLRLDGRAWRSCSSLTAPEHLAKMCLAFAGSPAPW